VIDLDALEAIDTSSAAQMIDPVPTTANSSRPRQTDVRAYFEPKETSLEERAELCRAMNLERIGRPMINSSTVHEWLYPDQVETRQYQRQAVEEALFNNVLIVLPTGLGKTLVCYDLIDVDLGI
jgi:ATP-dependent helicase YprA (DUF1998 family)